MRYFLILTIIGISFLPSMIPFVFACECFGNSDYTEIFDNSEIVFVGTVNDIVINDENYVFTTFDVHSIAKGELTKSQITTSVFNTDCSVDYKIGTTYVVAIRDKEFPSTSRCTTKSLEQIQHYEIIPEKLLYALDEPEVPMILDPVKPSSDKQSPLGTSDDVVVCGNGTVYRDGICIVPKSEEKPIVHGDCLIATASYGSDLSPQVQMLREIRDDTLLNTESGKIFMNGFNSIYYSFSPTVAQWENQNPAFKESVKLFITPMIATLSIMTLAEEDSEFDVIFLGVSTIGIIVGMYVVTPVVLVWKVRKRK